MALYLGLMIIGVTFTGMYFYLLVDELWNREDEPEHEERSHVRMRPKPYDWEKDL